MKGTRSLGQLLGPAVLGGMLLAGSLAVAGPPPMDPRQMSGMSRVDPQVPAGTVTVRCLLGSFSEPAIGVTVKLELTDFDGKKATREAAAEGEGRAVFSGLEDFIGGHAIASVQFGAETVTSRRIELAAEAGSRVMLVKGAGTQGAAEPGVSDAHGASDKLEFGKPFPLDGPEPGMLIVGLLDRSNASLVENVEVKVTITPPGDGAEPIERTVKTDARGRAAFSGLRPPEVPEGSKLVVEAVIGGETKRSNPFELGEKAAGFVLAHGKPPAKPEQRAQLPGPRKIPKLPSGSVQVRLVDAKDAPVAGQEVEVVQKDMAGDEKTFTGQTGDDGIARLSDLEVRADALYFVGVRYDGAPYQSSFFELVKDMGVAVDMRVFPTTDDVSRVRSAIQLELHARENDLVAVTHVYQVFVDGDEAYWPDGGLEIHGAEGAKHLVVLRISERWLEEKEGAPFAILEGPIPPGETVHLSIAYALDHNGTAEIRWKPPFPVMESSVILPAELKLEGATAKPPHKVPDDPRLTIFPLGEVGVGSELEASVSGLPVRNKIFRLLGATFGLVMVAGVGFAVATRPRRTSRDRLTAQRDDLFARLEHARGVERERILAVLDRIYRQLDAFDESTGKSQSG